METNDRLQGDTSSSSSEGEDGEDLSDKFDFVPCK